MKMFFFSLLSFGCLLSADEKIIDLSEKMIGEKFINWHGPVIPAKDGRMVLKGRHATVYCVGKFPVEKSDMALIRFNVKGCGGTVGLYFYDEKGGLLGSDKERIPNTENERDFDAEFRIPALLANKRVFSIRVYFGAEENLALGKIVLCLKEEKR